MWSGMSRSAPSNRRRRSVELISPVSGVVISVNEDITDEIGVINSDPNDTGWMIIVDLDDPEELDDLLDARGYQEFLIQEAEVD